MTPIPDDPVVIDLDPYKDAIARRERMDFVSVDLTISSVKELIAAVEALRKRVIILEDIQVVKEQTIIILQERVEAAEAPAAVLAGVIKELIKPRTPHPRDAFMDCLWCGCYFKIDNTDPTTHTIDCPYFKALAALAITRPQALEQTRAVEIREQYLCPGCMVREPWEHWCCRDEEDGRMCECVKCYGLEASAKLDELDLTKVKPR